MNLIRGLLVLLLMALATAQPICAQVSSPPVQVYRAGGTGGGGGAVSSVTGNSSNIVCSPTTGSVLCGATYLINTQSGTSYTVLASDMGKLVLHTSASAVAVTLPAAGGAGFTSGASYDEQNAGAGTVTITPVSGTINGGASLAIAQNTGCTIVSDNTNWQVSTCTALANPVGFPITIGSTSIASGSTTTTINGLTLGTSIALGTPASGTMTNVTGLPIATGVSGLGTGVATLLASPSNGTGGPAGTTAPTFSGTVTATNFAASGQIGTNNASVIAGVTFKGGNSAAQTLTIMSTSGVGTADSIAVKTGSQVTAIGIDTNQLITLPRISSDATHTDAAVCEDTTSHALYSGSGTLGVCLGTSTREAKTAISLLENSALGKIMQLVPVSYKYRQGWGMDTARTDYGFIAEDVEKVLPQLVGHDAKGRTRNYDYVGMIAFLVKAVQQQQVQINALKTAGYMRHRDAAK